MNFEQLGLCEASLKALNKLGFTEPTPIQEQSIPALLADDIDLLGLAQTGTGKTAAFALPIIEKIDANNKSPQALILCPTRELCLQITSDIEKFLAFNSEIRAVAIYGGASIVTQIRELRRGVQIIVATPGRMIDVIDRGEVRFGDIKIVVLDEADEMLNMGFKESINQILSKTPDEKNTWLFTATMPKEIKMITKKYMNNPMEVQVSGNKGNDNIEHEFYLVNARDKYNALKRLVDFNPDIFGIVFCRTKNETKEIADQLIRDGYNSDALHGDLTQQQRDIVMNRYRERSLQLLIATDVAARGIDVSDVTHVINYALPDDLESYTHRSGRTARAGKKGVSIAIITKKDIGKINEIERMIGKKFVKSTVPTGFDVCEKQLFTIIDKAKAVEVNEEQMEPYMEKINAAFEGLEKEEIIKRFASLEFNRFLDYYKNSQDLNMSDTARRERGEGERGAPQAQTGFTRFFINVGDMDDLRRGDLLKFVCDNSNVKGTAVGKIDMKGMYSFFEVESEFKGQILSGLKGLTMNGRSVRVDEAGAEGTGGGERRSGGFGGERRERSDRGSFGGERRSGGYGDRRSGGGDRNSSFGGERRERSDRGSFGGGERRSGGGERNSSFGGERRERSDRGSFGGGDRNKSYGNNDRSSSSFETNRNSSFDKKDDASSTDKPKKRENKFPYSLD
jgi:ATP-dependent RNA helicase DeaD